MRTSHAQISWQQSTVGSSSWTASTSTGNDPFFCVPACPSSGCSTTIYRIAVTSTNTVSCISFSALGNLALDSTTYYARPGGKVFIQRVKLTNPLPGSTAGQKGRLVVNYNDGGCAKSAVVDLRMQYTSPSLITGPACVNPTENLPYVFPSELTAPAIGTIGSDDYNWLTFPTAGSDPPSAASFTQITSSTSGYSISGDGNQLNIDFPTIFGTTASQLKLAIVPGYCNNLSTSARNANARPIDNSKLPNTGGSGSTTYTIQAKPLRPTLTGTTIVSYPNPGGASSTYWVIPQSGIDACIPLVNTYVTYTGTAPNKSINFFPSFTSSGSYSKVIFQFNFTNALNQINQQPGTSVNWTLPPGRSDISFASGSSASDYRPYFQADNGSGEFQLTLTVSNSCGSETIRYTVHRSFSNTVTSSMVSITDASVASGKPIATPTMNYVSVAPTTACTAPGSNTANIQVGYASGSLTFPSSLDLPVTWSTTGANGPSAWSLASGYTANSNPVKYAVAASGSTGGKLTVSSSACSSNSVESPFYSVSNASAATMGTLSAASRVFTQPITSFPANCNTSYADMTYTWYFRGKIGSTSYSGTVGATAAAPNSSTSGFASVSAPSATLNSPGTIASDATYGGPDVKVVITGNYNGTSNLCCFRYDSDWQSVTSLCPGCRQGGDGPKPKTPLLIYPNPAGNDVIVELAEKGTFKIYAPDGKLVYTQGKPTLQESVSLDKLPSGRYLVNVVVNGKVTQGSFVKQ